MATFNNGNGDSDSTSAGRSAPQIAQAMFNTVKDVVKEIEDIIYEIDCAIDAQVTHSCTSIKDAVDVTIAMLTTDLRWWGKNER